MTRAVSVTDALRRKAVGEGAECVKWLVGLGGMIEELERDWGIVVGNSLPGGTASFVAEATAEQGTPAVVKLAMPAALDGREALDREVRVLRAADGRGCVRLLRYDSSRGAVLLERLGRQLAELGLPLPGQLEIICDTLRQVWAAPADPSLPSGADKASWLASFVTSAWDELGRPCPQRVVAHAMALAERRAMAFDPDRAVLVHGDGHVWNTLVDPTAPGRFRLVDPDGLFAEPEYDLAIPLREHHDELITGDPVRTGRKRARFLARQSALDEQSIWEWAYLERVATGLLLIKLQKNTTLGQMFLEVSDAWVDV